MTGSLEQQNFYAQRDSRTNLLLPDSVFATNRIKIVLTPGLESSFAGQALLLLSVNLCSRLFRRIVVACSDATTIDRLRLFGEDHLHHEVLAIAKGADPFIEVLIESPEQGQPLEADFVLCIGFNEIIPSDIYVDGNFWNAYVSRSPRPAINSSPEDLYPIGGAVAVCLGIADAVKAAIEVSPQLRVRTASLSLFTLDTNTINPHIDGLIAEPLSELNLFRTLQVGSGAVGSSLLFFLRFFHLHGTLELVDHDVVDVSNLSKSPLFFVKDIGLPKVQVAQDYLAWRGLQVQQMKYSSYIKLIGRRNFDLVLPLADEENVRWSIQNNIPPLTLQTSTSAAWGVVLGRHIPLIDDCISCRFPPNRYEGGFVCGQGRTNSEPNDGKNISLPFQPALAGLLLLAELIKVARKGYPLTPNYVGLDLMGPLSPGTIQRVNCHPNTDCVCQKMDKNVVEAMIKESAFFYLSEPAA